MYLSKKFKNQYLKSLFLLAFCILALKNVSKVSDNNGIGIVNKRSLFRLSINCFIITSTKCLLYKLFTICVNCFFNNNIGFSV